MTLVQLANFVRIVELQSVSKAAAAVRIAQPALSRQVRLLEQELGTGLLERHAWGVRPTPAGMLLVDRARRLLVDAEATGDLIRALAADPVGRVVVGVPSSLATVVLPPLLALISERLPKVRPYLVDGFSASLHARALTGELDIAVLYNDRTLGPLAIAPLLSEPLLLIEPVEPVIGADRLRLILPARPNRLRLIVDAVASEMPDFGHVVEIDSLPTIVAVVGEGRGRTILPFSTVVAAVAAGGLRTLDLPVDGVCRELVTARVSGRTPTAAALAVEGLLREVVADLAPLCRWRPSG